MEKFNPHNPEYHSDEDLPEKEQTDYVNVEGGFVKRTVLSEEEKRGKRANEKNEKRSGLQKLLRLNKTTPIDVAHEEALLENEIRSEEVEDWATVDMSPQEIVEGLQREFSERAKYKGIDLYSVDTENFTDWPNADKRVGGYFSVRKAFGEVFRNGLKPTEPLESLKECDFRFSRLPKSDLETDYDIMPIAFELAPILVPRYAKDGVKEKVVLKFVMHVPKKSSMISIKTLPYQKSKAVQKAEVGRKEIKRISAQQWAINKSYNLKKAFGDFKE